MKVIYFSKTGNTQKFIEKIKKEAIKGSKQSIIDEPFILITYTEEYGEIPKDVEIFCKKNEENLKYVVSSGSKMFGVTYGRAGDLIASKYNCDLMFKFELEGTKQDVNKFDEKVSLL